MCSITRTDATSHNRAGDCGSSQQNVRCCYRVVFNNFVFQQDSAPLRLAFNAVQLMQCKILNFFSPELWTHDSPELKSTAYEI